MAERRRLANTVVAQGVAASPAGDTVLVALEMATNLNLGSMLISTQQMNPLEIESILKSLGVDR